LVSRHIFVLAAKAIFCYNISVFDRDCAADEYGTGLTLRLRDKVEAVIHAVNEVDIRCAGPGEKGFGAGCAAVVIRMARLVNRTHIGLGFRDAADELYPVRQNPYDVPAQKVAGHLNGAAVVKIPCQRFHTEDPFSIKFAEESNMDHLLGMHFTSIWWAFLYLIILCVAATVLDRIIGRLVGRALSGTAAKAVRLVLVAAVCGGVLWGVDALMDGVWLTWWSLAGLAVLAAVLMVLPENAQPGEKEK